jgi:hypothetical protein
MASAPSSWCYVLVHSTALSALVNQLPTSSSNAYALQSNLDDIEICDKCVWAIGNLAGDSEMARDALQNMGAVGRLIACLSMGISIQQQQQQQRNVNNQSLIDLIRNCVWTMTNLVRGGMSCEELLEMPSDQAQMPSTRLYPRDIAMLLSSSEDEIANESCWLMSFLTRDTEVVDFLCAEQSGEKSVVISTLLSRLFRATDAVGQLLNNPSNASMKEIMCLIPCCRALKNIAMATDAFVESILLAEIPDTNTSDNAMRPAEASLARLISLGMLGAGNEVSSIASEAADLAGTLLYYAGFPLPFPAMLACRTLLPALVQALICPISTFAFKREAVWALWNAVDIPDKVWIFPPELLDGNEQWNVYDVQNDILAEIIRASPDEMARALIDLLSTDADATEASLSLIDLLLRRELDSSKVQLGGKKISTLFEEAGLVDALWRICDEDTDESAIAELAAEILDDFYEQEEEEEEEVNESLQSGHFQFQTPCIPEGGFNFGA